MAYLQSGVGCERPGLSLQPAALVPRVHDVSRVTCGGGGQRQQTLGVVKARWHWSRLPADPGLINIAALLLEAGARPTARAGPGPAHRAVTASVGQF